MANAPELVTQPRSLDAESSQPPKLVGVFNLLVQAFCLYLVACLASPSPSGSNVAIVSVLCLALGFVIYKTLQRTFFLKHMPARWNEEDSKVVLARRFQIFLMIALFGVSVISLCFLFFHFPLHSPQVWQVLFPVVALLSGISDLLQDRLPLRPRRRLGVAANMRVAMKPLQSDHWGVATPPNPEPPTSP